MSKTPHLKNGTSPSRAPRNKLQAQAYHKKYGELLAAYNVMERKSAQFGSLFSHDRFSTITKLAKEGYTYNSRKDIYKKSLQLYEDNEIVRPAVNLIASSIFSQHGALDMRGSRRDLIETIWKIIDWNQENNDFNFHDLARDGELAGNLFL